jgi:hypothetical protein
MEDEHFLLLWREITVACSTKCTDKFVGDEFFEDAHEKKESSEGKKLNAILS